MALKTVTRPIESFLCKLLPSPMDEYKNGTGTWHGDGVTGVLGLGGHVYTWVIGNMGFEKIKLRVVFSRFWSILPLYFLETRRYKLCHLGLPYKKFKWENFTWALEKSQSSIALAETPPNSKNAKLWRFCRTHSWAAKPQNRAPQSRRGFSALNRLYYLTRQTGKPPCYPGYPAPSKKNRRERPVFFWGEGASVHRLRILF